jgi:HEAT repeat protein
MTEIEQCLHDLQSTESSTRARAAETLARAGIAARVAVVPLVRGTGDADESVREWSASALEELGPPDAGDRDALASLLRAPEADVGYWAATLLGRLRAEAAPTVPALTEAVRESPHMTVQQRAAWALGEIGPPAAGAIPDLDAAAESDDPRLSRLARRALAQIRAE